MPVETQQKKAAAEAHRQQQIARVDEEAAAASSSSLADAEDEADNDEENDSGVLYPPASATRTFYDRVPIMAERFAATRFGQFVIERADRALRVVEDTAKWSLPQDKSSGVKLERALPWLPFLYLIVLLRLTRICLSMAALMIGNGPVTAHDLVYFIQTRRRKLRAVRVQGMKAIHQQQHSMGDNSGSGSSGAIDVTFIAKMRQLLASAICRPGMHREPARRIWIPRSAVSAAQASGEEGASSSGMADAAQRPANKRPRDEDDILEADANMTVDQLLTKYANADSDDDEDVDFEPTAEELQKHDQSTSSGTSSSAESGDEAGGHLNKAIMNADSVSNGSGTATSTPLAPMGHGYNNNTNKSSSHNKATNNSSSNNNNTNHHNESVEFHHDHSYTSQQQQQQHQAHTIAMPMPLLEVKKEPDTSGTESPARPIVRENGSESWQAEEVERRPTTTAGGQMKANGQKSALEVPWNAEEVHKATPGHESAAMMKPKTMLAGFSGATATAAAPHSIRSEVGPARRPRSSSGCSSCYSRNRIVSCSFLSSSLSSLPSGYRGGPLDNHSNCSITRPHSYPERSRCWSWSRSRSRSSSMSSTSSPSLSSDRCSYKSSDLDSFQSFDDTVSHMSLSDPEGEREPAVGHAKMDRSTRSSKYRDISLQCETNTAAGGNQFIPKSGKSANMVESSSADEEFYSPVGTPNNDMLPPAMQRSTATNIADNSQANNEDYTTPKLQRDMATDASYPKNQKNNLMQQNRYRNRNRR